MSNTSRNTNNVHDEKKLKICNGQNNMKDKIKRDMKCLTIEIGTKNLVHIYLILPILKEMVIPCGGRAQPHYC